MNTHACVSIALMTMWAPAMAQPLPANRPVVSGRNDDVVYLAPATEPYGAMPLGNSRLGIGVDRGGGSAFEGGIDEVRLYRCALSAEKVKELAR